jgi:hypothetical protein
MTTIKKTKSSLQRRQIIGVNLCALALGIVVALAHVFGGAL